LIYRPLHHHVHVGDSPHLRHRNGAHPGPGANHDPDPADKDDCDERGDHDKAVAAQRGFEDGRFSDGQVEGFPVLAPLTSVRIERTQD
jgi:hypothetical protein